MKNVHIVLLVCFALSVQHYPIYTRMYVCNFVVSNSLPFLYMVTLLFNSSFIQAIFHKKYSTSSDVWSYADVRDMVTWEETLFSAFSNRGNKTSLIVSNCYASWCNLYKLLL